MNTKNQSLMTLTGAALVVVISSGSALAVNEWMATVNLNALHARATGHNVLIGQIESGTPRLNHVALDGAAGGSKIPFVRSNEGLRQNLDHATHVAGILAGRINSDGAGFRGAAPAAKLASSNWIDPAGTKLWEDDFLDAMTQFFRVAPTTPIINMSAGSHPINDPATERLRVQKVADWMGATGYLFVAAAGNEGATGLRSPGSGYNVLTVGATGETGALKNYNKIADYSAIGPATEGGGSRMKPDLVAPGSRIYSPRQDSLLGNFNRFSESMDDGNFVSGTSFATPIVSGVAACLHEWGNTHALSTDPKVMRAVLMNSTSKSVQNSAGVRLDKIATAGKGTTSIHHELGTGQLDAGHSWSQYRAGEHNVAGGAIGTVPSIGWDLSSVTAAGIGGAASYLTNDNVRRGTYMTSTVAWNRNLSGIGAVDGTQTNWADWTYGTHNNIDIMISKLGTIATPLQTSNNVDSTSEHSVFKAPSRDRFYTNVMLQAAAVGDASFAHAWE